MKNEDGGEDPPLGKTEVAGTSTANGKSAEVEADTTVEAEIENENTTSVGMYLIPIFSHWQADLCENGFDRGLAVELI
jgi:hypothetical protein